MFRASENSWHRGASCRRGCEPAKENQHLRPQAGNPSTIGIFIEKSALFTKWFEISHYSGFLKLLVVFWCSEIAAAREKEEKAVSVWRVAERRRRLHAQPLSVRRQCCVSLSARWLMSLLFRGAFCTSPVSVCIITLYLSSLHIFIILCVLIFVVNIYVHLRSSCFTKFTTMMI